MTAPARTHVAWHRRLAVRLFAASVVVAAFAVAATAWLTVRTANESLNDQRGAARSDVAHVYSQLIDYAATHSSWSGAADTIDELARQGGHRVVLRAPDARFDSARNAAPVTDQPGITVDALAVTKSLDHSADAEGIARTAAGPFTLAAPERAKLIGAADAVARCIRRQSSAARVVTAPSGRPYVVAASVDPAVVAHGCGKPALTRQADGETLAVSRLQNRFFSCMPADQRGQYKIEYVTSATSAPTLLLLGPGSVWTVDDSIPPPAGPCLALERRQLLAASVAPPARLYVVDAVGRRLDVSPLPGVSPARIALAATVVLGVAALLAGLGAVRLSRSLRAITAAAQRMRQGDVTARVAIGGARDDITHLASTFNQMADAVQDGERQRQDMIADISHELRTPLTNIKGWLEALQDGIAIPDAATLTTLTDQTRQLEHVIDDLREVALADAGQLEVHPRQAAASEILARIEAAFAVRAHDAGITLDANPATPIVLSCDPSRMIQCLGNLVSNAIAHTAPGGLVTVRVRAEGNYVLFEVTDDGSGIEPADLVRVFDRLWRADESRTRRSGGSGLGLPIARWIARAHGGDITATSTPGQGSIFTVFLLATTGRVRSRGSELDGLDRVGPDQPIA